MSLIHPIFKISLWILTIFITMSVLVACGNSEYQDLEQHINKLKEKKPEPIPPLPTFKTASAYTYAVENLRSPFAPTAPRKGDSPNANRPKEPLEAFPLDGLRMVGSLIEANKRWAIITAPSGMIYYVTVGNYIGQNYGRIINVDMNKIELLETVQGNDGWVERPAVLKFTETQ